MKKLLLCITIILCVCTYGWTAGVPFTGSVGVDEVDASGTRDDTTFLRGDGTWNTPTATVEDLDALPGDENDNDKIDAGLLNISSELISTDDTLEIHEDITRDTEWDTAAEINAATTDEDFIKESDVGVAVLAPDGDGSFLTGLTASQLPDAAADGATKGVCTFNASHFSAASGVISLNTTLDLSAFTITFGLEASDIPDISGTYATAGHDHSGVYQPADEDLTTYAGITPSANVQTILGCTDYAAMRTALGLVIGTDVQAAHSSLTNIASNWTVDESGNVAGIGTIEPTPTEHPQAVLYDSDAPGATTAEKAMTYLWGEYVSGEDDAENSSAGIAAKAAGAWFDWIWYGAASDKVYSARDLDVDGDVVADDFVYGDAKSLTSELASIRSTMGPREQTAQMTLYDPDSIQAVTDAIPMLNVNSSWAPSGITITDCGWLANTTCTMGITFEEWTSPSDGSPATIETVSGTGVVEAEDDGTLSDAFVAAGSIVYVDLDTNNLDYLNLWITYTINAEE